MSDPEREVKEKWKRYDFIDGQTPRFFDCQATDSRLTVRPSGEVDLYYCPFLKNFLDYKFGDDSDLRFLHLDLTETKYIDSTFLGILVRITKLLRSKHGEVVLTVDDDDILKILEITGLNTLFSIRKSSDAPYDWQKIEEDNRAAYEAEINERPNEIMREFGAVAEMSENGVLGGIVPETPFELPFIAREQWPNFAEKKKPTIYGAADAAESGTISISKIDPNVALMVVDGGHAGWHGR